MLCVVIVGLSSEVKLGYVNGHSCPRCLSFVSQVQIVRLYCFSTIEYILI
jgi:hypothetical protein